MVFMRNGEVHRGDFRNNYMEGAFELVTKMTKEETKRMFMNAKKQNDLFISLNKENQKYRFPEFLALYNREVCGGMLYLILFLK